MCTGRIRKGARKPSKGGAVSPFRTSFEPVNFRGCSGLALTIHFRCGFTADLVRCGASSA